MGKIIRYCKPEDTPIYKQSNYAQVVFTRVLHQLGCYHFKMALAILKVHFGF